MAKKVTISGYYGFKNFGDELILSILTKYLHARDYDVTVFSVDTEFTRQTYNVKAERTFDIKSVVKTLFNTDILISGGGSLFQDATSVKSVIYYAFVLGMAQLLGKRTIIFAQGIGPLRSPISRFLVKTLFKKCNSITVRDENSLQMLENWGIKTTLVEDPAYSLSIESKIEGNTLGVQLRKFSGMGTEFLVNLARAVAKHSASKVKVFVLQKSLDEEICSRFVEILSGFAPEKEIILVEDDILSELTTVETLVSMRFHSLIVGLKAKVRCAVINYDPKVMTLARKYSLPLIEFDDTATNIEEKIKHVQTATVQACGLVLDL